MVANQIPRCAGMKLPTTNTSGVLVYMLRLLAHIPSSIIILRCNLSKKNIEMQDGNMSIIQDKKHEEDKGQLINNEKSIMGV